MTNQDHQDLLDIANRLLQPNTSFEESQAVYKEWYNKGTYDKLLTDSDDYVALNLLQRNALKYLTDKDNQVILDIGAGTGLSGLKLQDAGFKNLHALEPLKEFADEAMKKGIYSKMYVEPIGINASVSSLDDTYDGVVACGAFGPGHIPCQALHEIVRITKSGGYFILCMRKEYTDTVKEYTKLEPLMKQLEEERKWRMIVRETYPHHFLDKDGLLFVFQIC